MLSWIGGSIIALGVAIVLVALVTCHVPTAAKPARPSRARVGLVVHVITALDSSRLLMIGARRARITWYVTDPLGIIELQLDRLDALGLSTVCVVNAIPSTWGDSEIAAIVAAMAIAYPRVIWQLGNEPPSAIVSGASVGVWFRSVRNRILGGAPDAVVIPPGLPTNVPSPWLRDAIAAGLGDAGVVCLHATRAPLVAAVRDRRRVAAAAGWGGEVWMTELGVVSDDPAAQARELVAAIAALPSTGQHFLYALWSDADRYGLTAGVDRRVLPAFTALSGALT